MQIFLNTLNKLGYKKFYYTLSKDFLSYYFVLSEVWKEMINRMYNTNGVERETILVAIRVILTFFNRQNKITLKIICRELVIELLYKHLIPLETVVHVQMRHDVQIMFV